MSHLVTSGEEGVGCLIVRHCSTDIIVFRGQILEYSLFFMALAGIYKGC
jgi:hypothetical protein